MPENGWRNGSLVRRTPPDIGASPRGYFTAILE
jgi:hypothetical protein